MARESISRMSAACFIASVVIVISALSVRARKNALLRLGRLLRRHGRGSLHQPAPACGMPATLPTTSLLLLTCSIQSRRHFGELMHPNKCNEPQTPPGLRRRSRFDPNP